MSDKYNQAIAASKVIDDDAAVSEAVAKILNDNFDANNTMEVHKFLLNTVDLTTLNATDSPVSVAAFVERVNAFDEEHPELRNVAAICTYPNFAQVVRTVLDVSDVDVCCVSGGCPSSQTVEGGADEIDIVLNLGNFFDGDYEEVCDEIIEQKHACRDARLKVILETGALQTAANIKKASVLALYSGADFLKTSTGKGYPGASLDAAYVMCECIKEYYEATGTMVGFKAAGGVRTTEQAVQYYTIVKAVLGEKWLTNEYFRLGASSLANNLLSDILGEETKFF